MRVVCENCGATYKIPESKLVKEVNKATCRKCGFRMMIRRPSAATAVAADGVDPDDAATQVTANPLEQPAEERELLEAKTRIEKGAVDDWSDDSPTNVQADPTQPTPVGSGGQHSGGTRGPAAASAGKTESDMILALVATFASAGGAMLLATNTGDVASQRMLGLGVALWGALTCLFLLVTGNLWRQKGNLPISIALATVLSAGGAAFVEIALHESEGINEFARSTPEAPAESTAPAASESPEGDSPNAVQNTQDDGSENSNPPEAALADEGTDDAAEPSNKELETNPAAARTTPTAPAQSRSASRASTSSLPQTQPDLQAEPEVDDELELEDPIEDFDDFAEPRSDAVADAEPTESAEEKRRKEMEAAAAAREAERERKAKAAKEAKEAEKKRAQENAKKSNSGSSKMSTLPLTVVDTMIRSNMSVKRCFFNEKQESGEMPRRVNVRFTVLNSGRVSSARVTTDQFKGGNLDSCLGRAFKVIQFPPFEGEAKSMTYPFVL